MAHSSPEGIELSKGSNLESFNLSINKEKVLELKEQKRMYSEEEVKNIISKLARDCYYMQEPNQDVDEWFEQFKK